jgi:RimJ/RimL family protein N-acetyltransferase
VSTVGLGRTSTEQDVPVVTRLRPPRPEEEAVLARWRADPASEFDDFAGGQAPGRQDVGLPVAPPGLGRLVVTDGEDVLIGSVSWHEVTYGPNRGSTALSTGISLRPPAQGAGHGTRAQRMLAEYLFASLPVHRLQASTDVANRREQRALESAGYRLEGTLRGAQWRRGGWHDLLLYSRLRGDG